MVQHFGINTRKKVLMGVCGLNKDPLLFEDENIKKYHWFSS